jgi:hypothetical protein
MVYVPKPKPISTGDHLVGAFHCPLWKATNEKNFWNSITAYPERTPLLGYYDEGTPEVTDWEIKFALEHGIGLFIPCWFRARNNRGKPIQTVFGHWLHEGLFQSRYGEMIKFALLWENANGIACGVESERDLFDNLLPYWIENYFRRPNYLREQGKPVVFLYGVAALMDDLGGAEKTKSALQKMRFECKKAGLNGLVILGEYHGHHQYTAKECYDRMKAVGMDYSYSYHWPTFTRHKPAGQTPDPSGLIAGQEMCWTEGTEAELPHVLTVSAGWDSTPWGNSYSSARWRLSPSDLQETCERARRFTEKRSNKGLSRRMILLDNWNEYGEGHYIFPVKDGGFAHLDAIRQAFATKKEKHIDVLPKDIGLGPYDNWFQQFKEVKGKRS